MKKEQKFVVVLILALLIVVFALMNSQAVVVNLFGAHLEWPLIIIIVVSLLIGAAISMILSWSSISDARKQTKKLQSELNDARAKAVQGEAHEVVDAEFKDSSTTTESQSSQSNESSESAK